MLAKSHRHQLLRIARSSIEAELESIEPELDPGAIDPELNRPAGAFVSLHTAGRRLRGCIGSIYPVAPLCHAVSTNAINAAFRDPRFLPLQRRELSEIAIEISVMSPIELVQSPEEIVVGRDGLIIRQGRLAGLLLPQVATEYGWHREMFLSQTCIKAGLSPDAWRSPQCRIEKFSADVFGEHEWLGTR